MNRLPPRRLTPLLPRLIQDWNLIEPLESRIAPAALASYNLGDLDGTSGFQLQGGAMGERSGRSVSDAGDVNGDGFDDLLIGALAADPNGTYSGASYVVFGQANGFSATLNLSTLNGNNGFILQGVAVDDRSGRSVSAAGDVNGDGFDDLLIGAYKADPNGISSGASYVVFGQASGFSATLNLADVDGTSGFKLQGVAVDDRSGFSVSAAGDVNGDGFDDLIIGAYQADPNGFRSGTSYVVFGQASGFSATFNLSTLNGTNGFKLQGEAPYDHSGFSVSAAGDVNGDGFDDLIIGAYQADPNGSYSGASYVIFGKASGFNATLNLSTLNGSNGFKLNGETVGDRSGFSVSAAGDVNGDGFDDLIIGAYQANPNGSDSGSSYVVFGRASGFNATLNLSTIDGSNGFKLQGVAAGDQSGVSVSTAGDFNGDGFDDLIIGASKSDPNGTYSGTSYVVFGQASGFSATLNLSTLNGNNGFKLQGEAPFDFSGLSVSDAGDVNGDGFDDLIIGAYRAATNGGFSGTSYVVFGFDTGAVTQPGDATANFLIGTSGADVIIGGTNDDILFGGGGADVLRGGEGDDELAISDLTFHRISGGNGTDTLIYSSDLLLDLTILADNQITSIERIDLSRPGNHTLTLDVQEVLNISDESNTLLVDRDTGDTVNIGSGWTNSGFQNIGGAVYETYTQGAATLLLQWQIKLQGEAAGDFSGLNVGAAGDVNGDGFDDFIIGAHQASPNGSYSGASYVVFGKANGLSPGLNLSTLDGANGFKLQGEAAGDFAGHSVSTAGDVNGDGFDDLLIGAVGADPNGTHSGASYVVFGKASGFSSTLNLSTLNGTNGFKLQGEAADDASGANVSTAGDVNGDGFDDLLIMAGGTDGPNSGTSYVVFGHANGFTATFNLSTLNGTNGFKVQGEAVYDYSGTSISAAGDVNGDGFDDLLIGALGADPNGPNSGASYVVFGKASGFSSALNLSTLDGANGFKLQGEAAGDLSGQSVSGAGDVNGDGFDDIIIGAYRAAFHSGASYVVFGQVSGFSATMDLSTLDGSNGFKLQGEAADDYSGRSVSAAGDVNGDGFDDLIIGAHQASPNGYSSGTSYVVFGQASGFSATLNLSALGGGNGYKLHGEAMGDNFGRSVSAAGDVNGDGFDDLIIGAFGADPDSSYSYIGASYVFLGFDFGAVTHSGDSGVNTLTGTSGADVMIGGTNEDTLIGSGGADVLRGGEGDDVLAISDLTFQRISGGSGSDTLRLDGSDLALNLTTLADNKLTGIERIDLTGSGNNTLTLDVLEAFNLSSESNTLIVDGDEGDTMNIGAGWELGVDEVDGPTTYQVLTQGAATLKIDSTVALNLAAATISVADVSISEGNSGTANLIFTVSLSSLSFSSITVSYATANGTAIAPGDYTSLAGQLTFAPGETSKTISVPVFGETLYENGVDETLSLILSNPFNATLSDGQATGTIFQDDASPANVVYMDAQHPFTFFDANHDRVTVRMMGPGLGAISLNGGAADNADISEIQLVATTLKSALSVTVIKDGFTGDGFVNIGEVKVGGSLQAFTGKDVNFTAGGFTATGAVKTIVAHNLTHGEIITGGLTTETLALTLANVADGTLIQTTGIISSLKTVQIGDGSVIAAGLAKLSTSAGAMNADLTISGLVGSITTKGGGASGEWTGSAFKSVAVTGGALSADITSIGAIAKITVKGGALSGDLEAASFGAVAVAGGDMSGTLTSLTPAATLAKVLALKSLTVTEGDLTGDIRVLGSSGAINVKSKIVGGSIIDATIVAKTIAGLNVARNLTSSLVLAGADLGYDHALGGGDDTFATGTIGAVKITGNVSGSSVIGAGLSTTNAIFKDGDDSIAEGIASVIKNFTIIGTADSDSYFAAGIFKAAPKIGGVGIATTDPRFKVA